MSKEPKPKQEKTSAFIAQAYFAWLIGALLVSGIFSVFTFYILGGKDNDPQSTTLAVVTGLMRWVLWLFIGWIYGGRRIQKYYVVLNRKETLNYFALFSIILYCIVVAFQWKSLSDKASSTFLFIGIIGGLFIWSAISYGLAMKFLPLEIQTGDGKDVA